MAKKKLTFPFIYLLGFLEFVLAAVTTLQIDPDPKNAAIFGYSPQRAALFILILLPGLALLIFGWLTWRGKINHNKLNFPDQKEWIYKAAVLGMMLLAALTYVTPYTWLGFFSGYFHRLQPFLVTLLSFPAQWYLAGMKWPANEKIDRTWLDLLLIISGLLAAFWLIVWLTGLGITPENEISSHLAWFNIAGTPVTMLEWLASLFFTLATGVVLFRFSQKRKNQNRWLDIVLMLGLLIITGMAWSMTPNKESTFVKISPPYFQPYPTSDALVHDMGGLSILMGQGINFDAYTDKPLYMVFLAILHFFSGYNYSLLVSLQIWLLACMAPALYWFGKSFHSRGMGLLSALLLLFHQVNAIQLTNILYYNAAPNLLLTEVPTLFSIILFTWACFAWLKNPRSVTALAAGGILGASSLLRLNSFLILPFIPLFALLVTKNRRVWLRHSLAYLLGFCLLISPWLVTGQDAHGRPYFVIKFFDTINARYSDTTKPLNTPTPSTEAAPEVPSISTPVPAIQPPSDVPEEIPTPVAFWFFDINRFPGFVFNNAMHNITESILELPDSFSPNDQVLSNLNTHYYWKPEEFNKLRLPGLILNTVLIAFGLAWSWRRWKWAGLVPLLIFLVYSLSLALGRTSGSRYLVPIDWLILFYFSLGSISVVEYFLAIDWFQSHHPPQDTTAHGYIQNQPPHSSSSMWAGLIVLVLAAALIPIADRLVPKNDSFCNPGDLSAFVTQQPGYESIAGLDFRKGLVIYPTIENKSLTFGLLSCDQIKFLRIKTPSPMVTGGETVVAGWPKSTTNASEPLSLGVLLPVK